jgi:hypothetical protein
MTNAMAIIAARRMLRIKADASFTRAAAATREYWRRQLPAA